METFLNELKEDGLTIFKDMFNKEDMLALNDVASELPPFVGNVRNKGWHNWEDVQKLDPSEETDWLYHWAVTPEDNSIINNVVLPVITDISNTVFEDHEWGWQTTNRYIMSNLKHDMGVQPHLDAPYLWPQKLDCQMAKYLEPGVLSLTFMIPLTDFTPENGATAYAPGTHKYIWDTANWNEAKPVHFQFFQDNYIQPSVEVGGFACFYGNCMHSVMANQTDEIRRGIIYRAIRQDALDEMKRIGLG